MFQLAEILKLPYRQQNDFYLGLNDSFVILLTAIHFPLVLVNLLVIGCPQSTAFMRFCALLFQVFE